MINEHGDIFYRKNDFDDCGPVSGEGYEDFPPNIQPYYNQRPSPAESDYFYDQYVDYPINETLGNQLNNSQLKLNQSSPYVDFNNNKFTLNQFPPRPPQPTSAFTFFGHPLPSLGNIWGQGRTANNRASGENSRGKGRVQIFKAGDPELQVNLNGPQNEIDIGSGKNPDTAAASIKNPVIDKGEEKFYRPFFQTSPFSNQLPPMQKPHFPPFNKQETPTKINEHPFSQPRPEKGFSPMIPGSVGGFIPIKEPSVNDTKHNINNSWPKDYDDDETLKEVPLVTKADTTTKRPTIKAPENYITAQIEKVNPHSTSTASATTQTTLSHLQTSISPILSTLIPKPELITEKSNFDHVSIETESSEIDIDSKNLNKKDFEEEVLHESFSTTTIQQHESEEVQEDFIDEFNQTTNLDLSADHLIAPGSIISHEETNSKAPPALPTLVKPGKITKVFTPAPPTAANSNEITKLISPFYQHSSETPENHHEDNEYQPNQIYQQTFNELTTDQYQREDMEWYWKNYNKNNQTHSNPILNYNSQPFDNRYGHYNSGFRISCMSISNFILIVVINVLN